MRRAVFGEGMLWWGSFWAAEVFVLALGLIALTVRTFDDCFDRIPDKPGRIPLRAVVVMILSGMIGSWSLVWSIDALIQGVLPRDHEAWMAIGVLAYILLVTIGLLLIATVPASLISARDKRLAPEIEEAPILPARDFVLGQWWSSFRLVMLLAIGPAILVLALGTAHKKLLPVAKETTLANGAQVTTWEPPDPARAKLERSGEVRLGPRLLAASAFVVTILAHGATAVAIGLAMSIGVKRSRRAFAAVVGLIVVTIIIMPIYLLMLLNQSSSSGIFSWNFVIAANELLTALATRLDHSIVETIGFALLWDVVVTLFTAGILWLTIRMWELHALRLLKGTPDVEIDIKEEPSEVESALVAD